jgi:hypothetical protein
MEELRKSMIAREQARKSSLASSDASPELQEATLELKNALSEKAINAMFDGIAEMGRDYDSPEERQDKLNRYSAKAGYAPQDKKPRSPLFRQVLQEGKGGSLLGADQAALAAVAAMEAGDMQAARTEIAKLLPGAAAPAGTKTKKSAAAKPDAKGKKIAADNKNAPVVSLASPHLGFAVGKWLIEQHKVDQAETYAKDWVAFSRAPARAFLWRASHQASRKEFAAANATLDEGRQRLGSGAPFLPQMVTFARSTPDIPRAQALTQECKAEEQRGKSTVSRLTEMVKGGAPSGIYAECLARLGTAAPPPEDAGNVVDPLQKGVKAIKLKK